jgi:polyisoprenoid-binding protein YceI
MKRLLSFPLAIAVSILVLSLVVAAVSPVRLASAATAGAAATTRYVIVSSESEVLYRVNEVLFREGNRLNVAVGRTKEVRGEVVVDRANPRNSRIGTITVNISTFQSDSARRDNAIRTRWLESARFPSAEFRPKEIDGLPATYTEGQQLRLKVTGDLKVRDVTKPTTFEMTVMLRGSTLTGAATAMIKMTDFGFDPPSIFGILRTEDEARLELQFVARPQPQN